MSSVWKFAVWCKIPNSRDVEGICDRYCTVVTHPSGPTTTLRNHILRHGIIICWFFDWRIKQQLKSTTRKKN